MHICIIGIGGVGKAHALSAAKYLDENHTNNCVITLVDFQEQLEKHLCHATWVNSWGPIKDYYNVENEYGDEYININRFFLDGLEMEYIGDQLRKANADLYIIATPNKFHQSYVKELTSDGKKRKIICEKPAVGVDELIDIESFHDVHLGIEWLYHPKLEKIRDVKCINFVHGYPPEEAFWDPKHEVYDLGSHVIAIYQYLKGKTNLEFTIMPYKGRVRRIVTEDGVSLSFGYEKGVLTDTIMFNDESGLDWIPFEDGDLFYKQIKYVIEGGAPLLNEQQIFWADEALEHIYRK